MFQEDRDSGRSGSIMRRWFAAFAPAFLLLAGGGGAEAEAMRLTVTPEVADTLPLSSPRLFQRRILFSPEYLRRALDEATARKEAESVEVRAKTYVKRYGINPELARTIIQTAEDEGIDPELAFRLVRTESVFRANARGPSGALGLTQLMPSTARSIDRSLRTDAQILEPETNLRIGFRYLRDLILRYNGDVRLGVLAYNRGEIAVDRAIRAGRDPENGYSRKVLGTESNRYAGPGVIQGEE